FGAESTVTSPGKFVREMWNDLRQSRQLAGMLAFRDLKAQYRQSFLGWFWLVIPPIAWTIGMTVLRRNNLADLGKTDIYYPAYVLIGMSMWQMFTAALRGPMNAMTMNKGILTKVRFPREAIILADLMKLSVEIVVYLLLIVGAFVWYQIPVSGWTLLFPFAYMVLVLLGTTVGLFLAPIGLLYRDIGSMLPYLIMAGLVITPVLFPMPGPENDGIYAAVVRANPVTPVLVTARELATSQPLTQFPQFLLVTVLTLGALVLAMALLRAATPQIVERWSS
ncbi:MAG: ABC transporter permease, partial [Chthoniobacterales bacterium]